MDVHPEEEYQSAARDGQRSEDTALASAVRAVRSRLQLTQKQLAGRLSIQQNSVSRIENGSSSVSVAVLMRLLRLSHGSGEQEPILSELERRGIAPSELSVCADRRPQEHNA